MNGGSNDEAERARQEEEARQRRIREGTSRINDIFDGGTRGVDRVADTAAFDPERTYYTAGGDAWSPEAGLTERRRNPDVPRLVSSDDSGTTGDRYIEEEVTPAQQFARALNDGLYAGTETTGGFDDEFFADRRQSYIDFARPQLDQQFADAKEQLIYSLARAGTTRSSIAGDQGADLQREYDINLQDVTDKAREYETKSRTGVEDARANLIATLNATGDAEGAANAALARATALSETPAYSPVGQLFGDFSSGLAQQAALERAEAATGRDYAKFNTGWFGAPKGAVKTT